MYEYRPNSGDVILLCTSISTGAETRQKDNDATGAIKLSFSRRHFRAKLRQSRERRVNGPLFLWYLGTYGPYDKQNRPYDKKNRLTFRKYLA